MEALAEPFVPTSDRALPGRATLLDWSTVQGARLILTSGSASSCTTSAHRSTSSGSASTDGTPLLPGTATRSAVRTSTSGPPRSKRPTRPSWPCSITHRPSDGHPRFGGSRDRAAPPRRPRVCGLLGSVAGAQPLPAPPGRHPATRPVPRGVTAPDQRSGGGAAGLDLGGQVARPPLPCGGRAALGDESGDTEPDA